ncbi:magnesium transporter [Halarchaeum nitratireducens]|uniref:Membrane protein n=1 Tax=Halarchaeum nitratireducens TaxID=489913 RepID=A0A830G7B2_9EURY|nr:MULTISPECIES: magnesium transporter [Halarchaeum]MBP2252022.1 mgtE-like transporter [Halarchaeum solikamskense]GGN05367.1 membrane protein [Halarchaeum nitratireducens]
MSIRDVAADAYREAVPALVASTLGGLFAGVVLGGMRAELRLVPGLLVCVPALLATRGNVYGSLGARLATGLHQGLIEAEFEADDRLVAAGAAAMANGLVASAFAAALAFCVLLALGRTVAGLGTLVAVALVAGLLSGIVLTGAVVAVVFVGFRRGYNPDALVGPLVTTIGDVFGLAFLVVGVEVVLGVA